jgi:hypothetical protein
VLSSTVCQDCSAGTYSNQGAAACTSCEPHTYQDLPASGSCLDCAFGTYQPEPGSTECTDRNDRRCWKAKDLKNPAFVSQAALPASDALSSEPIDLLKAALFCSPAGLDGAPVANADPRQCCYKIKGAKLASPVAVEVSGAVGGTVQLEVSKRSLLCEQCMGTGAEQPLQCWKVKDLKNPPFASEAGLAVVDGLASDTVDTKKPALYCEPVGISGAPIEDQAAQQCCYKVKGAKLASAAVVDTLGAIGGDLELEISKPSLVCEPCSSMLLP